MTIKQEWDQSSLSAATSAAYACNCVGPRNGQPLCPCAMVARGVFRRKGRWIEPEKDLGPARDIDAGLI